MAISNPDRKVLVLWLIAISMITWRELKAGDIPPPPFAYVGSAIVFGFAAVLAEAAGDVGVYLAVGWCMWIAYGLMDALARGPKGLAGSKPKGDGKPKQQAPHTPGGQPGRPTGPIHGSGPHPHDRQQARGRHRRRLPSTRTRERTRR